MTPLGFSNALARSGIPRRELARRANITGQRLAMMARPTGHGPRCFLTRNVREALLSLQVEARDARWRASRRHRAALVWAAVGGYPQPVRPSVLVLDAVGFAWMADWLLRAWPDHLGLVAAGVAADALAQGVIEPWDELVGNGVATFDVAVTYYDEWTLPERRSYSWEPRREDLIP